VKIFEAIAYKGCLASVDDTFGYLSEQVKSFCDWLAAKIFWFEWVPEEDAAPHRT